MQRLLSEYTVDWYDWLPDYRLNHQCVYFDLIPEFFTFSKTISDTYVRLIWIKYSLWESGLEVIP